MKSLGKLRKLIGSFEKGPGLTQTQANIIPGEQKSTLSLSPPPGNILSWFVCVLSSLEHTTMWV